MCGFITQNKMKMVTLIFCILLPNTAFCQNIFVASGGNDLGSGNKHQPFATIERALAEISKARKDGKNQVATIYLREGIYRIHHTLKLERISDINIQAYKNEKVIFSGGIPIPLDKIETMNKFTRINLHKPLQIF